MLSFKCPTTGEESFKDALLTDFFTVLQSPVKEQFRQQLFIFVWLSSASLFPFLCLPRNLLVNISYADFSRNTILQFYKEVDEDCPKVRN